MIVRKRNISLTARNTTGTAVITHRPSQNLNRTSSLIVCLFITLLRNGSKVFAFSPSIVRTQTVALQPSGTTLFAAKKKMNAAAAAALAAIDQVEGKQQQSTQPSWMDDDNNDDNGSKLSKKDLKKALASKKGKAVNVDDVVANIKTAAPPPPEIQVAAVESKHEVPNGKHDHNDPPATSGKSKKELLLEKALELEQSDEMGNGDDESSSPYKQERAPKLSAKELKALKKKEEKMAAKLEKKAAKKAGAKEDDEDEDDEANDGTVDLVNGADALATTDATTDSATDATVDEAEVEVVVETVTLEDKIRKERPPPRIRVMENTAQGFTSLRLENVGITFRNQQVLNDVTWGVQTGDRIGLVGANGAGMSIRWLRFVLHCFTRETHRKL
jgi:hypothetical protein